MGEVVACRPSANEPDCLRELASIHRHGALPGTVHRCGGWAPGELLGATGRDEAMGQMGHVAAGPRE